LNQTDSIAFGFYNGLGDIISDLPIIKEFVDRGFLVEVFVYEWLKDFTSFLLPKATVKSVKNTKDIKNISVDSENFFLTPNYLHKFSYSKTAFISYILKAQLLKRKVKNLISVDAITLLTYTFDIKKSYLDSHFFDMSYKLIKQHYDISYPDFDSNEADIKKVFLFPFSGREDKDYPQEKFLKLLRVLKEKDIDTTVFVQQKDQKKLQSEFFNYQVKSVSLQEIYSLMDEQTLVIANDSGTAHLGAMRGATVIALYGETDPDIYKPRGRSKVFALRTKSQNVKDISFDEIVTIIEKLNFT